MKTLFLLLAGGYLTMAIIISINKFLKLDGFFLEEDIPMWGVVTTSMLGITYFILGLLL